jgi:hypothetical protein
VVKIVIGSDEGRTTEMTKIVLNVKKDVSAEQAEMLKLVIKSALASYLDSHIPVEKNIPTHLRSRDPEAWHELMAVAQKHVDACVMLNRVKAAEIEIVTT